MRLNPASTVNVIARLLIGDGDLCCQRVSFQCINASKIQLQNNQLLQLHFTVAIMPKGSCACGQAQHEYTGEPAAVVCRAFTIREIQATDGVGRSSAIAGHAGSLPV